jgi:hypothetical protein
MIITVIPVLQIVSQLLELQKPLFRHSGLDPESSAFSSFYSTGCRIKSGMTVRKQAIL